MKTTIDLPDELLHRAKVVAAQRKTSLKQLVIQGLEYSTSQPDSGRKPTAIGRNQDLLDALSAIQITEPIGKWNRDDIHDRQAGSFE